jgi:hypothetical protein
VQERTPTRLARSGRDGVTLVRAAVQLARATGAGVLAIVHRRRISHGRPVAESLADEQAALRRVATFVAKDAPPPVTTLTLDGDGVPEPPAALAGPRRRQALPVHRLTRDSSPGSSRRMRFPTAGGRRPLPIGRVLQQRGLADPGLAMDHQHAAAPTTRRL